ncbi:MAG: hypothetical protein AAGE94_21025, partial [Acidobacteriota bacterium]
LGILLLAVVLFAIRWLWKKATTNRPDQWAEPPRQAPSGGPPSGPPGAPPNAPPPGAAPPPPPPPT